MALICDHTAGNPVRRIYLSVPPEEYQNVKDSGAIWDGDRKSWYIDEDTPPERFSHWLGQSEGEPSFGIVSDEAYVAAAPCRCLQCRKEIEVICLFCMSGMDAEIGIPVSRFTVSNIWAMDDALSKLLQRWPHYRQASGEGSEARTFVNHCPQCGAVQPDYSLHSEPGNIFFGLAPDTPGTPGRPTPVEFTPLRGRVQFSGDYGFEI